MKPRKAGHRRRQSGICETGHHYRRNRQKRAMEEFLFLSFAEIALDSGGIVDLRKTRPRMRSRRGLTITGNARSTAMVRAAPTAARRQPLTIVRGSQAVVAGISSPLDFPRAGPCQLVAIQIANEMRRIENRPRPACGRAWPIFCASASRPIFRVRCDHDGDVMIGKAAAAIRLPERHRVSSASIPKSFSKNSTSGYCCPCRSPPQAQSTRKPRLRRSNTANGTVDAIQVSHAGWRGQPACSPSNCAINDKSSPSPASMVPSISLAISSCHSGAKVDPGRRHCGEP